MSLAVAAGVLVNIDLGELPDEPDELFGLADIANLACGGHAGDDASMRRGLERCRIWGAAPGAHPSYPDRAGFGRRPLDLPVAELRRAVAEQCGRLAALAAGSPVAWVKPHGALYHAADGDADLADAVVAGARLALASGLTLIGPPGGALAAAAVRAGIAFAREGFADRSAHEVAPGRWQLVPRDRPGALILEPELAAAQAARFAGMGAFDTLCVHGDTPGAPAIARAVRAVLAPAGGARPFGDAALRFDRPLGTDAAALLARARACPGVVDAVVTEGHVLCAYRPGRPPPALAAVLAAAAATDAPGARAVVVRVRYDGPDLDEVAAAAGLDRAAVVALHSAGTYTVRLLGFLPGFAYLGELDLRLRLPRRDAPRPRVPALAVGIAGPYTGVYPFASAGGWHLLGTAVDFVPFRNDSGAALRLGDRVRFEAVP